VRWRSESGQAMPFGLALVGLGAVLTMAVGELAGDVIDAARARTAADAAALAGVTGGRSAADRLAARNGGAVIAWGRAGRSVTLTVRVGDAVATARATDEP
jgi:hypothetical protein